MIEYTTGNLLNADVEALVNTVNCVGVMGRGVALQFKNAYPENYQAYVVACGKGEVQPGRMFVYETGKSTNPRYIINFPTKRHWKAKSRMEDIEAGLGALVQELQERDIRSIAIPPLGSGLGGLVWETVRTQIEIALRDLSQVKILIFEPGPAAQTGQETKSPQAPTMTPGRAALICLIDSYLQGLLDTTVTLLEVHKLMYFMQVAGEPLRLNFKKGPYGPYADNLRHVLNAVEGYYLTGYADGGDDPGKQLQIVQGVTEEAQRVLRQKESNPHTSEHFEKVRDLVSGFESPFGLELLSTVHWVVTTESVNNVPDLVSQVYSWNSRKKCFSPRQIQVAADTLTSKGWIPELDGCQELS